MVRRREAVVIYTLSIILGALTQGSLMKRAIVNASLCSLSTATSVSAIPSMLGIPLSVNFALYTSQIGCELLQKAELTKLIYACEAWAVSLILCFAISIPLQSFLSRQLPKSKSLIKALSLYRLLLMLLSSAMSFVVGANTFGFLIHFAKERISFTIVTISTVLGSSILYRKSLERFAFGFFRIGLSHAMTCLIMSITLVEAATLLSIPLSASLISTTSIYASGFAAPYRIIRSRNYVAYLLTQVASIPLALSIGFLISLIK